MVWAIGAGSLVLLVLIALGLIDLIRNRHRMETWQVVVWAVVLVVVPVVGLISYVLWRIARSDDMQDSIDFQN
jgi:heme/copper-type cytochrome/quinol oxidase subunit 2